MTHDPFKYAKFERERRFLVSPALLPALSATYTRIEDLYITGTQIRLRAMTELPARHAIYKLTQKLQLPDPSTRRITTLYLTAAEHRVFAALPGSRLVKRRHHTQSGEAEWGVDVFEGSLAGLVLAEREFPSERELREAAAPDFAVCEVTDDETFAGGALVRAEPETVLARARELLAR